MGKTKTFGEKLVTKARHWIGTPFHWEASLKGVGCDCRGLVAGVAREMKRPEADEIEATLVGYSRVIDEKRLREGLERLFDPVTEWEPGDVLLLAVGALRQPVHLAIYAGEGRMIHCYSKGPQMVLEVPMGHVWRDAVVAAYRWRALPDG